jgi:prevent-host-death family protein
MRARVVTVTDFKADPASYLETLGKDAEAITITRRGRPVAVLSPPQKPAKAKKKARGSSEGGWANKGKIVGDIVNYDMTRLYDCLK